jgi:hypothetical protein
MNGINEKKTEINLQSISNELLGYKAKPYDSLFEYIWNAFDASATRVEISYEVPEMGISLVIILHIFLPLIKH